MSPRLVLKVALGSAMGCASRIWELAVSLVRLDPAMRAHVAALHPDGAGRVWVGVVRWSHND